MTKSLADRLPTLFPSHDAATDFAPWVDAHQDELDRLTADVEDVKQSLQVAHATGDELDRIGADFGVLGKRRGRDDEPYRQFLMSLVSAYRGRGTPPGVRTAVAAGILADEAAVSLVEDFDANRYEVVLADEAWSAHRTGTIHDLADLADPSVVQRRDPLHYILDAVETRIEATDTDIAEMLTAPTATVRLDVDDSTSTTVSTRGLSASELEPLSQGGTWNLSET